MQNLQFDPKINEKVAKKVQKPLSCFDCDDASIGVLVYIIMQFLVTLVAVTLLRNGVKYNNFFYFVYAFFVEGVFGLAVLFVSGIRKRQFIPAVGFKKKMNGALIGCAVVVSIICLLGLGRVSDFFVTILNSIGYTSVTSGIQVDSFGKLLMYTILIGIMPALCEELLFRGLVLNGLARYGKNLAVFGSAFFFMIMHGNPDQTVHQFILGVIFGYIVYYTGNIWITIIIHFCNNFFVLLINFVFNLLSSGETASTEVTETLSEQASVGSSIVSFIISAAIVAVSVYLIYKVLEKIIAENKNINGLPDYVKKDDFKILKAGELFDDVAGAQGDAVAAADGDAMSDAGNSGEIVCEKTGVAGAKEGGPKVSVMAWILFAVSIIYFAYEWIAALIEGFSK